MVNFNITEMFQGSETNVALAKQQQTQAVRDTIASDEQESRDQGAEESREDIRSDRLLTPFHDEVSQYGVEVKYKTPTAKSFKNIFTGFTEEDEYNVEQESNEEDVREAEPSGTNVAELQAMLQEARDKADGLQNALNAERARSSCLATEMQANADEWAAVGAEMVEEFKKSSAELSKERERINELERALKETKDTCSIYEGQLNHQLQLRQVPSLDGKAESGGEKITFIQEKLAESKQRWLLEKQDIYEKDDKNLAEAYELLQQSEKKANPDAEAWLMRRNEIIQDNEAQMTAAFKVVEDINTDLDANNTSSLVDRQAVYERVENQLTEAYKIICKTELSLKQERTKWLVERQAILEKNDENMAHAFMIMRDAEMSLAAKKFKLDQYEAFLNKRETEVKKTLSRHLELKTIRGEKVMALVDELELHKTFAGSEALNNLFDVNLSEVNAFAKDQQHRLAYERSIADNIIAKITEKKKLMKVNEEVAIVLEKSNMKKEEFLDAQQKMIEEIEEGRREKETQLKLNQEAMKQLEASIAEKKILEKAELAEAEILNRAEGKRKLAVSNEEKQVKELEQNVARKQALVEFEEEKKKTLEQTIAQKRELIETEVATTKALEVSIAEKEEQLAKEQATVQELKALAAEKDSLLAHNKQVVEHLQKIYEEKQKVLEAQQKTEAVIRSHLKNEKELLASKQAAVENVKEVRIEMETELEHQKDLTAAIEQQIVQKQSLASKEEYIKKCLEHLSMHQRELMPPGVVSSLVGSYFGAEYRVQSMIEETHLASKYIKTQIREQYAGVLRRRDESFAMVTMAICNRRDLMYATIRNGRDQVTSTIRNGRDQVTSTIRNGRDQVTSTIRNGRDQVTSTIRSGRDQVTSTIRSGWDQVSATVQKSKDQALALVPTMPTMPSMPTISLPSVDPRSLVARLKSYGVNVDLFPKDYFSTKPSVEASTE